VGTKYPSRAGAEGKGNEAEDHTGEWEREAAMQFYKFSLIVHMLSLFFENGLVQLAEQHVLRVVIRFLRFAEHGREIKCHVVNRTIRSLIAFAGRLDAMNSALE
jgi:hypothetical protein